MKGIRKAALDAVHRAQGQGCAPGILGIAIGGDRGSGYMASKEVLFRKLGTPNSEARLDALENRLVSFPLPDSPIA